MAKPKPFDITKLNGRPRAFKAGEEIYRQGDLADDIFFVRQGKVTVTVTSTHDKKATVGIVDEGMFFGEKVLTGARVRISTASAIVATNAVAFQKDDMQRLIQTDPQFAAAFMNHLLERNTRMEADLIDQLFNTTEKRLARLLLILSQYGREAGQVMPIPKSISQGTLAEMVGTTRTHINGFMNKFRRLGFIEYDGGIEVHAALLNAVLLEKPIIDLDEK